MEVFEVAEFEFVVEIEVALFWESLGLIFAQELTITGEWLVVRARWCKNCVSRKIIKKGCSSFAKMLEASKIAKNALPLKGVFLAILSNSFDLDETTFRGISRDCRIRIHHQNWAGTIFGGSGSHFCSRIGCNLRTVGCIKLNPWDSHEYARNIWYIIAELEVPWQPYLLGEVGQYNPATLLVTGYSSPSIHPFSAGNFHLVIRLSHIAYCWYSSWVIQSLCNPHHTAFPPECAQRPKSPCNITQVSKCRRCMWTL